jgi:hypothetical protein
MAASRSSDWPRSVFMRPFPRTGDWTAEKRWIQVAVTAALAVTFSACGGGGTSSSTPDPDANSAPVISGTPPPVATTGSPYSFTPDASDPDGDPLTFEISGKPSWAAFNSTTGEISGVPTSDVSGSVNSISISVSDGRLSARLAFSITVNSGSTPSRKATLSWSKPTRNADGTTLRDLAGYKVYYGQSRDLVVHLDIVGGSITSTAVEDLTPGVWYFSMTSVNESGVESDRTPIVSVDL